MQPYSTESVYVNYLSEEGEDRVQTAYGGEPYTRLVELKPQVRPEVQAPRSGDYPDSVRVVDDALRQGRDAFERRSWGKAFAGLSLADRAGSLSPEDLERLATSAWMTGRDADADESWLRAHQEYVGLGDVPRAARCAFWQATCLLFRGDVPSAMGWIARGRRLLEDSGEDSVEQGGCRR